MDSNTNQTRIRIEKYDPRYGQNVREIKSTDIVVLSPALASTSVAATDTALASTTTDAYSNMYLVGYSFSSTIAQGVACMTVSTSTYLAQLVGPSGNAAYGNSPDRVMALNRKDSPLLRVPESTTVSLRFNATVAGTVTGYAVFIKEPLPDYIETE